MINGLDQQVKLLDDLVLATSRRLEDVDPEKNPTKATVLSAQLNSQLSEQSNLRVERSGWQSMDSTTGNVVSPATLPVDSTSLGAPVVLVGVVAAALVVGFLVALIRDRTDPRVHSSQDIQELVGATPVNVITTDDDADDDNKEWFGEWYGRRQPPCPRGGGGRQRQRCRGRELPSPGPPTGRLGGPGAQVPPGDVSGFCPR